MVQRLLRLCGPNRKGLGPLSRGQDLNSTSIRPLLLGSRSGKSRYNRTIAQSSAYTSGFARRPGSIFRSLLLAEYNSSDPLEASYWREHKLTGVIADPFMGGGTPIFEANRLGFSVLGADTNPMAFWIVRQALGRLDIQAFASAAEEVASAIEAVAGTPL